MERTYIVTGAASGIGAAATRYLRERGARVITSDLHDADVIADLSTRDGRAALVNGVNRLTDGRIDAIAAVAGGGPPETSIQVNFFGAVATLEGLRPLLKGSDAPRAMAVSSVASISPIEPALVAACLSMDEGRALSAAKQFAEKIAPLDRMTAEQGLAAGLGLYANAKHALNRWCRRAAAGQEWAGAGITLNVLAPGFIDTPAASYILDDNQRRAAMRAMVPMRGAYPGRSDQIAAILAWCVSPENSLMTGQVLFVDGGVECSQRGDSAW